MGPGYLFFYKIKVLKSDPNKIFTIRIVPELVQNTKFLTLVKEIF